MAKRKSKKKQQEEELLIDLAEKQEQAREYYQRNQMLIIGGLFAAVFIFGGWYVYKNLIKAPQEKEASAQLYGAEKLLGDAHSELNEMDKALSYYKQASEQASNEVTTPYYLLKAGMLMEKQGQKDNAISMYEKIKSEYPKSIQGNTIDKYIARISNK